MQRLLAEELHNSPVFLALRTVIRIEKAVPLYSVVALVLFGSAKLCSN